MSADKYEFVYVPYNHADSRDEVKVAAALGYSDMESGELESISRTLDNTQKVLTNLIVFLIEKKLLVSSDLKNILGQPEEENG